MFRWPTEDSKDQRGTEERNRKIKDLNPNIPVTTLNVNSLHTWIKRDGHNG